MKELIRAQFAAAAAALDASAVLTDAVAESAAILIGALRHGKRIYTCGNGGSAADAEHFAAEVVGRFETERVGLPCLALTTNTSLLTAWSNDRGFDSVFARQVRALGTEGDVLVAISTSGNSPSVLEAMSAAADIGMARISLTGGGGGKLAALKGACHLVAPTDRTSRIQEVHITIIHIWARLIDDAWRTGR